MLYAVCNMRAVHHTVFLYQYSLAIRNRTATTEPTEKLIKK